MPNENNQNQETGQANGSRRKPRGTRKGKGNIDLETKAAMVAALPLANGCKSQVARDFGVSADVVERAAKSEVIAELADVKKDQIAQKLGTLVDKLTSRFIDIADGATLDNKASILLGIAADKHRLYSEQPTQITENRRKLSREEAEGILAEYERRFGVERAFSLFREDDPELASTLVQ